MRKHTIESLEAEGYRIRNVKITDVFLGFDDLNFFTLRLILAGNEGHFVYGGYCLGNKCLSPSNELEVTVSKQGMESVMRILDVAGASDLIDLKGKYVRTAEKNREEGIKIIGNIIEDKWFDYGTFFKPVSETTESEGPCHRYVSSSCVDGSCPVARALAEDSLPLRNLSCEKCQKNKNKSCADCALRETPSCIKWTKIEQKGCDEA